MSAVDCICVLFTIRWHLASNILFRAKSLLANFYFLNYLKAVHNLRLDLSLLPALLFVCGAQRFITEKCVAVDTCQLHVNPLQVAHRMRVVMWADSECAQVKVFAFPHPSAHTHTHTREDTSKRMQHLPQLRECVMGKWVRILAVWGLTVWLPHKGFSLRCKKKKIRNVMKESQYFIPSCIRRLSSSR